MAHSQALESKYCECGCGVSFLRPVCMCLNRVVCTCPRYSPGCQRRIEAAEKESKKLHQRALKECALKGEHD